MPTRVQAGAVDDIPEGTGREVVLEGRVVALFRTSEGVRALDGMCPHAGGPLAQGMLRGCVVTCPWHGWQFDVTTGAHKITSRIRATTYPTDVVDGQVWVELP